MEKDFDRWNNLKKIIDSKPIQRHLFFSDREIWLCSLGINVGVEENGKNEYFERPVLIIKKFNNEMIWIVPVTSRGGTKFYHYKFILNGIDSWVCLSQIRTVSAKRLIRKLGYVSEEQFNIVIQRICAFIMRNPSLREGNLGGRSY
jgi:mRNA interferase MazF